jgi:hypothetical protein
MNLGKMSLLAKPGLKQNRRRESSICRKRSTISKKSTTSGSNIEATASDVGDPNALHNPW